MRKRAIVKKGNLCSACGRYYDRHVACDGLIVEDGKILLILRGMENHKGRWALIGGYLDWNETVEECIIREVKEEIGADTEIVKFFGVYSDPKRDPGDLQNVAIVFILKLLAREFILEKDEVLDLRWFPLDKLPANMAFDHRKIIEDYIKDS
ncbi:MAG: NUDIX hydrolase [Candidatus Levybacteria bacterium]|nr:NUDIX hydrolase [Candidatus Levybacteria bacterium]